MAPLTSRPNQFRIKLVDADFVSYARPDFASRMQVASKDGLLFLAPSQVSRVLGVSSEVFNSTMKEVLSASGENKSAYSAYFKVLRFDDKPFMMQFFSTDLVVKVGKRIDSPSYHHFCKWLADKSFFAMPDELDHSKFKFPKRA